MKIMQNHRTVARNQGFPKIPKSEVWSRLWTPFWEPFGVILAPLASKSVKKTSKKNTRKNSRKKVTQGLQAEGLGSLKGD